MSLENAILELAKAMNRIADAFIPQETMGELLDRRYLGRYLGRPLNGLRKEDIIKEENVSGF